ncbi:MAG: ABC transporter ATP-binding protein [Anaerolineae bacterium]|jgi:branched-chain amino acid transport system ATP-binding protein|nr:ABC transporter ATP-binding protein [Anaerolineae bacterium]
MGTIFECQNATKAYGGLTAVKDLSFSVNQGDIFAIAGPNGAGKTTLFDTITGVSALTSGSIRFEGQEIQRLHPDRICRLGISRTFQTTTGFDTQTVLTNALVGATLGRKGTGRPTVRFSDEAVEAALDALELCGMLHLQGQQTGKLPVFDRKRLMVATAMATQPKLLLLDEPVGGLNRAERDAMVDLIRKVQQSGVTVLLIEHIMKAVQALANRLLILHHGQKVAEGPPAEVLRDERVIEVYLGRAARHTAAVAGGGHDDA